MAYEIIGETVKSATSLKLGQIFNNPKRYKENITKQEYPNFHIIQVNLSITPAGINHQRATGTKSRRVQLDYLINIQYRVAENTENITNLQQQLDDIGLKLNSQFNELDLERPTKVTNKSYEKVDGVGQFMFNITVFATTEEKELIEMEDLSKNIELEEE